MARGISYKTLAIFVTLVNVAYLLLSIMPSFVAADPPLPATWMDTSANPSLQSQFTVDQATYNENTKKPWNECIDKTFRTRPARPGIQSEQTVTKCWYDTPMGWTSGNYAVAKGENIAGVMTGRLWGNSSDTREWFLPTLNSRVVLDRWNNTLNDAYALRYDPHLTKTTNSNGTVTYAVSYSDTLRLKSYNGSTTFPTLDVNYSENGKYVLFSVGATTTRVNLDTKTILNYGTANGSGSYMDTAASITNDGKYAAVTEFRGSSKQLRVFDLSNCREGEYNYITQTTNVGNCAWRDFKTLISTSIPSYNTFTRGEFLDNNTIAFYHATAGNPTLYTQYLMSIGGGGSKKYMALGDSIASGEGAYNYVYPTSEGGDFYKNNCHLSNKSYPYLIDSAISLDAFSSFACSGAKIVNIVGANGVVDNKDDSFKDNQYYDEDYKTTLYWSPGYERQIQKVIDQKPNIVTVNVSANDVDFSSKLKACLGAGTCFSSYEERKELANEINGAFNRSYRTFSRLKSAAAVGAKVYVIGYPKMFNASGACMPNVRLDADELQLANDFVDRLNLVLSKAAEKSGVAFVDVGNALNGSRHCEGGIGNVAANGLTVGDDNFVIGNESYHPNQLGHRKLRDAVLAATSSFMATMPAPNNSVTAPVIDDSIPLLANAPKLNRPLRSLFYAQDMTKDVLYKTNSFDASVKGINANTRSGTTYQAEIHSTPISLGTFTSNDSGDINISVPMPSGLAPGFHTLHIYGKDMDNKDIDMYKTIYIAASEEDWDGNGTDNGADPCLIIEPSGVDEDEDGIDDACDSIIGEIPEEEEEQAYLSPQDTTYIMKPGLAKYKKVEEYTSA
jgi:hypothetical protein